MWWMTVREPHYARHFWHTLASIGWHNPRTLNYMILHFACYLHLGPFAQFVIERLEEEMAELDRRGSTQTIVQPAEAQLAAAS